MYKKYDNDLAVQLSHCHFPAWLVSAVHVRLRVDHQGRDVVAVLDPHCHNFPTKMSENKYQLTVLNRLLNQLTSNYQIICYLFLILLNLMT